MTKTKYIRITAEEQARLTPAGIIQLLKDGNKDYVENNLTIRNTTERIKEAANEQYPIAVIISCIDSRIPVADVFHKGIGDIFIIRIAGNIVNEDIIGSIEYGCKVSGAKVVVVLGHTNCGAIKHAVNNVRLGYITSVLSKIYPAINDVKQTFKGDQSADNKDFLNAVYLKNVEFSINDIRYKSPILKEMEDKGEIIITGAIYDMYTGRVDFFEE